MKSSHVSTTVSWTPSDAAKLKAQEQATTAQAARMTQSVGLYREAVPTLATAAQGLAPWL